MSHDSCPTILTQSVAQCAQICADGGATIKQSPRLMALSQRPSHAFYDKLLREWMDRPPSSGPL